MIETLKKAKIVVLISGSGSNLQALINACETGHLNAHIALVISNRPQARGLARAERAGIKTQVIDHQDFIKRADFDKELARSIADYSPTLVVLAGFMRILSADFVDQFASRLLNVHPSLLPKYPGLNTHQRALDAGDNEAGATVHFVTTELDGGPAIVQAAVPIETHDRVEDIASRVLVVEHKIVPLAARWFIEGRLNLRAGAAELDGTPLPIQGYVFRSSKKTSHHNSQIPSNV